MAPGRPELAQLLRPAKQIPASASLRLSQTLPRGTAHSTG